ncbi:hypothetical protein, partial [Falsiroseomonas sp. CW058]|uniref:hypothetical protein n=1 Tax=Falsiroseomonas sp. CW058 TaxID=3388664 RepID=UPI003D31265D
MMPPVACLALPGGLLALAAASAACAEGAVLELRRDGRALAHATLGPAGGLATLLADRAEPDLLVLLRRLVAAAPAFRARTDPRFGGLCHAVAAALAARPAAALAGDRPCLWRLPEPAAPGAWHLLAPAAALRPIAAPEPGSRLLLLDAPPGGGALLLPPDGPPIALPAPAATPPSLVALARRGGAARGALA